MAHIAFSPPLSRPTLPTFLPGGLDEHLDAGLEHVVGIGEGELGRAPAEQAGEDDLEPLVDRLEGLPEQLPARAIDLVDGLLEVVERGIQIGLLSRQELEALLDLDALLDGRQVHLAHALDEGLDLLQASVVLGRRRVLGPLLLGGGLFDAHAEHLLDAGLEILQPQVALLKREPGVREDVTGMFPRAPRIDEGLLRGLDAGDGLLVGGPGFGERRGAHRRPLTELREARLGLPRLMGELAQANVRGLHLGDHALNPLGSLAGLHRKALHTIARCGDALLPRDLPRAGLVQRGQGGVATRLGVRDLTLCLQDGAMTFVRPASTWASSRSCLRTCSPASRASMRRSARSSASWALRRLARSRSAS
jgi:hypothetical protein